jgi:hypothetical protein
MQSSLNIFRIIKQLKEDAKIGAYQYNTPGENDNAQRILMGRSEGKGPLRRPRCR